MLCDRGLPRSLGGTWCHRAGVPVSCPAYGVPDQQGSTTASPRGGSGISPTESIRPRTARARRNGWTGCICQQQGSLSTAPRHSSDPLHHLRSAGPGFTPRFRIDHSHEQTRPVVEQCVQAHHDARALQVLRHGIRPSPTGPLPLFERIPRIRSIPEQLRQCGGSHSSEVTSTEYSQRCFPSSTALVNGSSSCLLCSALRDRGGVPDRRRRRTATFLRCGHPPAQPASAPVP